MVLGAVAFATSAGDILSREDGMRVTWARPSLPWASCPGAARRVGPVCRGRGGRLPLRKCASWGPAVVAAGIGRGWAPRPPGCGQRPRCPPQRGAAPPQPGRPGSVPLTSLDPAFVHACLPAPAATLASLPREHHRAPAPPASAPAVWSAWPLLPPSRLRPRAASPETSPTAREAAPRSRPWLAPSPWPSLLQHAIECLLIAMCVFPQKASRLDTGTLF